jgi:hypothetical protein
MATQGHHRTLPAWAGRRPGLETRLAVFLHFCAEIAPSSATLASFTEAALKSARYLPVIFESGRVASIDLS